MTLARYPEYKATDVPWLGDVPAHWDVKRLKHGFRLVTERATQRDNPVALENIESWSGEYIPTDADFSGEGINFQQGDVLFGKLRPYLAKAYLATSCGEAIGDFHVMRPSQGVEPKYGFYYLLSESFISEVSGATYGAKMPRIGWDSMGSLPFLEPHPSEQRQICRFLGHETARIDSLIEEQQRLIELLKEKRQAVISHAVTKGLDPEVPMKDSGVEWLGEVPAHWEVGALKRFWRVVDCKHVTADFIDDGYPLASIREVQSRYVDLGNANRTSDTFFHRLISDGRSPETGDLILSRNATVGEVAEVAAWHPPFAMGQDVCLLKRRCSECCSAYLYYVMKSAPLVEQISNLLVGSTFKRINVDQVCHLMVAIPPPVEQSGIAEFLDHKASQWDALVREAEEAIDLLWERRSALISAAVTGKIDVRGWEPPQYHDETPQQSGREVPA